MWLWFHTIPDEIGPMELESKEFVEVVENFLSTAEKVIVVLHQNLEHTLTDKFRKKSSTLININLENRGGLTQT
jgi:nucleoside-triphosphatase THEP1